MNNQECICDLNICKLYVENPIILPCCWSTICKEHENDFLKNDGKFKCPICNLQQPIPQNGFVISTNIINLIKNGDHLAKIQKKILNSIPELESKIKEQQSNYSEEKIYDFFSKLRNEVDLQRDLAIEQIHNKSEALLSYLKREEEKCNEDAKKMNDFNTMKLSSCKNLLKKPDFKEDEASKLLKKINFIINQINQDISNYRKGYLMNKKIQFFPSKLDHLGELKTNSYKISNDFGKLIKNPFYHEHRVESFTVIEDSNKLISADDDEVLRIWDLQSGECLKTSNDEYFIGSNVLIYKNNKFISSCRTYCNIAIWDSDNFERIELLYNRKDQEEDNLLTSSTVLSDNILVSGLDNGTINIWNINEKIIEKSIKAHEDRVTCLTKTKDSSKLISGSFDSNIKIWDSNNFQLLRKITGHLKPINCLKMLNDETILSGSKDETIRIWKIDSGECLRTLNFNDWVNCVETFNNDQMLIIAIGKYSFLENRPGGIIIYDLYKNEEIKRIYSSGSVYSMFLLSNGNLLTGGDEDIKLWNFLETEYIN
jgi:WD40 repeat protein